MYLTNTLQSQNLNFIALLFLPYHWSSWTVYVQQWGLTQRIPPFGDKLRQGLILWPKLAASSNTVSEKWRQQRFNSRFALHLRADSHHDREIIKKSCIPPCSDLALEHIANFWQQVCMACILIYHCQSCLEHWYTVAVRLTGVQKIRLSSNIKHITTVTFPQWAYATTFSVTSFFETSCNKSYSSYHAVHSWKQIILNGCSYS